MIGTLGLLTVVAYGSCYYAYGALIEPIADETRWPPSALGAIFSAVLLISGVVGFFGGRLFDRTDARLPLLLAAALGSGAMLVASLQTDLVFFAAAYAGGCGLVGALGFYHVTQAVAARASPHDPARAIVWLTILGALASLIYLPLTAALVDAIGWRRAIRVEAATVALGFILAAAVLTPRRLPRPSSNRPLERIHAALAVAWRMPHVRAWVLATLISGAAINIVVVFQVSIMVNAGLTLVAAATIAGIRGFAQLGGRIPLGLLLSRFGAPRTLVAAYLTAAIGAVLLPVSGTLAVAALYTVLAGASIGAIFSLQGIYTYELVDSRHLSMLLGAQQAIFAVGGALGPVLAGTLLQATGSHIPTIALTAVSFLAAAIILLRSASTRSTSPCSAEAIDGSSSTRTPS